MTFGYPRRVGSRVFTLWGRSRVMHFSSFHLASIFGPQFNFTVTFLFSLSYVFSYLPILPTSFEAFLTSIPVPRLVWFRSAEFDFLLDFCFSCFSSFTVLPTRSRSILKSRRLAGAVYLLPCTSLHDLAMRTRLVVLDNTFHMLIYANIHYVHALKILGHRLPRTWINAETSDYNSNDTLLPRTRSQFYNSFLCSLNSPSAITAAEDQTRHRMNPAYMSFCTDSVGGWRV